MDTSDRTFRKLQDFFPGNAKWCVVCLFAQLISCRPLIVNSCLPTCVCQRMHVNLCLSTRFLYSHFLYSHACQLMFANLCLSTHACQLMFVNACMSTYVCHSLIVECRLSSVSSSVVCRVPLSSVKKPPFFRAMVSTIKMGPRRGKWRHTITSTAEKWSALNALAHFLDLFHTQEATKNGGG